MAHIAVLDVGKTNKKMIVFSEDLEPLHTEYKVFEADESGAVHYEPVEETEQWFFEQLGTLARSYDIKVISITTHGATQVFLDEKGVPALPTPAYTTPVPDGFDERFYQRAGSERALHKSYATHNLGMANLARMIAFVQERFPEAFQRVRTILNYPQYFGFKLTGNMGADCTFTGCHSYLHDFDRMDWSPVADALGIRDLLPDSIHKPGDILGTVHPEVAKTTGLSSDTLVTYGIHDSNASLLPFLIQNEDRFALNSTGTWCVAMCPAQDHALSEQDIDHGVFYNCDAFGRPVKTSNFMGGQERSTWWNLIQKLNKVDPVPAFDPALCEDILGQASAFILPGVLPGTGPFPNSPSRVADCGRAWLLQEIATGAAEGPQWLRQPGYAMAVLSLGLAVQSCEQLNRAGVEDGMTIYIEGGFRHNETYCQMLGALYPQSEVVLTDLQEATAFGAALLGKAALEEKPLRDTADCFSIQGHGIQKRAWPKARTYRQAYLQSVSDFRKE